MPSPTKTKSETRLRRGRSRSRSRGRSKSPSRKAKQSPSPSRKTKQSPSPARKTKQTTTTSPGRKIAKVQSSPARAVKAEVEEEVVIKASTRSSMSTVSTQSTSTSSSSSSSASTMSSEQKAVTPGTRHSVRIAEKVLKELILKHESGEGDSSSKYLKKVETVSRSSKDMSEYGGPVATFFGMLIIPLMTFSLMYVCTKKSCEPKNFMNLHKLVPRDLASYYDRNAVLVYLGFLAFQVVLYLLPLGRLHQVGSVLPVRYRSNGFCAMVINLAVLITMWRYKCGVGFVYQKFHQLAVTSLVGAFVFSVILYMKGRDLKPSLRHKPGHTGCLSHDFAVGRELNPCIGPIHLKMLFIRISMISMMMINWVFMLESYTKTNQIDMPLLLTCVIITFLILDMMLFEAGMLNTATLTQEGLGALSVLAYTFFPPFCFTMQAKYLLEHPQTFNNLWLGFFVCLFFVGYIIRRGADSQKDTFRRDPHDPSVANLETMPTTGGRKLLVSGWWGLVRHPNYLGEVINMSALALFMGHQTIVPYIPVLFAIFNMFVRAKLDGKWCRQKHGAAWERYCQRVKYSIIPYVY